MVIGRGNSKTDFVFIDQERLTIVKDKKKWDANINEINHNSIVIIKSENAKYILGRSSKQ